MRRRTGTWYGFAVVLDDNVPAEMLAVGVGPEIVIKISPRLACERISGVGPGVIREAIERIRDEMDTELIRMPRRTGLLR